MLSAGLLAIGLPLAEPIIALVDATRLGSQHADNAHLVSAISRCGQISLRDNPGLGFPQGFSRYSKSFSHWSQRSEGMDRPCWRQWTTGARVEDLAVACAERPDGVQTKACQLLP